jgi:hypothetical protein
MAAPTAWPTAWIAAAPALDPLELEELEVELLEELPDDRLEELLELPPQSAVPRQGPLQQWL